MTRATEDYAFWRAALRGEKQPVHENSPQCGFYKRRMAKDGPWLPIAFWKSKATGDAPEKVVCGFQGRLVDPIEQWTYAVKNPVAEKDYRFHLETGHWPDEPEAAPIGHNLPSDPFEALKIKIDDKLEQAEKWLAAVPSAPSETDANMARNMQAQLLAFNKEADGLFEEEKRPITEAGRAVDAKFSFRKTVKDTAVALRDVYETFMKAEDARQKAEARRKFDEERRVAAEERARAEAERKRLEAEDPIMAAVTPVEVIPEPVFAPEPVKINVGGGFGRKAGLRIVHEPVIEDYAAALAHYAQHAEVRAVIEKLVKAEARLHKAQTKIPGVKMVEERRAA